MVVLVTLFPEDIDLCLVRIVVECDFHRTSRLAALEESLTGFLHAYALVYELPVFGWKHLCCLKRNN